MKTETYAVGRLHDCYNVRICTHHYRYLNKDFIADIANIFCCIQIAIIQGEREFFEPHILSELLVQLSKVPL